MLVISTWLWGGKYDDSYVRKLANSVHRNLTEAHRFICFTDRKRNLPAGVEQWPIKAEDYHLTDVKGCFARLRLFDPNWQRQLGLAPGDRIVNLDIDLVVTGELDSLFNRADGFTILQGVNASNPCQMNGSVWMLRAGYRPDVWRDFSLEAAAKVPFYSFPDDQGWFAHKIPDAGAWMPRDGVYGFWKPGWPKGEALPDNARIVAFFGWRDPSKFTHLKWVDSNWRE